MKLIAEWQRAYRMFSVQAMVVAGALLATWTALPEDLKATFPGWVDNAAAIAILAMGVIGRLVDQSKPPEPDPEETTPNLR